MDLRGVNMTARLHSGECVKKLIKRTACSWNCVGSYKVQDVEGMSTLFAVLGILTQTDVDQHHNVPYDSRHDFDLFPNK